VAQGDNNQVVYVDGDVPQLPLQLGQLLVDSSGISPGNTNLQQCTSQDPLVYEVIQGIPYYPRTPAEIAAGVTPVNYTYPPGYLYRYGTNTTPGTTDMTTAFTNAILANYGSVITVPDDIILVGNLYPFDGAGTSVLGTSQFGTILMVKSGTTGAIFSKTDPMAGTSAFCKIANLCIDLNGQDCTGVDLSSVSNTVVDKYYVIGGADLATAIGTGVYFGSPLDRGAYNNVVSNFRMDFVAAPLEWGTQANKNGAVNGDILECTLGANLAPVGGVGLPFLDNVRFEGCDRGILEGAQNGCYKQLWMEGNATSDVEFTADSTESVWIGGQTADTIIPVVGLSNAASIYAFSPDLIGVIMRSGSASRTHQFSGRNIFSVEGDVLETNYPTGVASCSLYSRAGRMYLDNAVDLSARDAAGTGSVFLIRANANDRVLLGAGGTPVQLADPLVALGGGAAPTLGTIGGSGPATAAQNSWKRFYDDGGNAFWVPVWK
jgi:hypothetical protein